MSPRTDELGLLTAADLHRAARVYLEHAYPSAAPPASAEKLVPPPDADLERWLMSDRVERRPEGVPFREVRAFEIRLGNLVYRHMKLRLSRLPRGGAFILSVDSHDAFLSVEPGSPDYLGLEELKVRNAAVARAIQSAWDREGLPTEHAFLRRKIEEARKSSGRRPAQGSSPV